jgi:hypothetical protein
VQLPNPSRRNLGDLQMLSMKPGDFALGSMKSRAAARLSLAKRQTSEERREVILGRDDLTAPRATEWVRGDKGNGVGRVISLPASTTIAEGLRALGGYSDHELRRIAEASSEPVHSCSIYTLRRH